MRKSHGLFFTHLFIQQSKIFLEGLLYAKVLWVKERSMNILESRHGLIKLIKVNSRGREIKTQLVAISPRVKESNASFRTQGGPL